MESIRNEKQQIEEILLKKESELTEFRLISEKQIEDLSQKCQIEISTVKQELEKVLQDNNHLKEEVLIKENSIDNIKVQIKELTDQFEAEKSDLKSQVHFLSLSNSELQNKIENTIEKLEAKTRECEEQVSAFVHLKDEHSILSNQVDDLKSENEQLLVSLRETKHSQSKELEMLQQSAEEQLMHKQREIEETAKEAEKFYLSRTELEDELKVELEKANLFILKLEQECSNQRNDIELGHVTIKEREDQLASLQGKLDSNSARIIGLKQELNMMLDDNCHPDVSANPLGSQATYLADEDVSTGDDIAQLRIQVSF